MCQEVELKDEKAQQVQAQSAIVKWRREGCMIQGLEVFPGRAPPTKTKAKRLEEVGYKQLPGGLQ